LAEAPGHQLGQIVGGVLEAAVEPVLRGIANELRLYLDTKGGRPARPGRKVTWTDELGNAHDLDFVLERGGTDEKTGVPAAFIEAAWRRYTKHSRNKVQEIQGALIPLRTTHRRAGPFVGAILAGDFTKGSIDQLTSNGFAVAYIPTQQVAGAFAEFGIEIGLPEDTPDEVLAGEVEKFEKLDAAERRRLAGEVGRKGSAQLAVFAIKLRGAIQRRVESVTVVALHGELKQFEAVPDAIQAIRDYSRDARSLPFQRFELTVRYSNGDRITAEFAESSAAIEFLETFRGQSIIP